jgi:hypothetical protein
MAPTQGEIFILLAVVAYGLLSFPTHYMTALCAVSLVVYVVTKSVTSIIVLFAGAALLRLFVVERSINPALPGSDVKNSVYTEQQREGFQQKEGFQPRDPISIHQRIEDNKNGSPLKPKTSTITGVLESPEILDSLQISPVLPAEQGCAMNTLPAPVKAAEIIPTPPELTPTSTSVENAPLSNPVLQNGPDNESMFTALIAKGTALFKGQPAADEKGVSSGPSTSV